MKTSTILSVIILASIVLSGCGKEEVKPDEKTGKLIVKVVRSLDEEAPLKSARQAYSDTTLMVTYNMKAKILDMYVSRDFVMVGIKDTLTWYIIGENTELKYWEEYTFSIDNLPVGEYKSMKMNLGNIAYRYAYRVSNPSEIIEMMETMGSYLDPCDEEREVPTNYFSANGNHNLDKQTGLFKIASEGEKMGIFEIKEGKMTTLYMKMNGLGGEEGVEPCTFEWIDLNNNGVWDCGVDRLDNFNCPPEVQTMADFVVVYE